MATKDFEASLFKSADKLRKNIDAAGNIAEAPGDDESLIQYISQYSAYMMLPCFANMQNTIYETLKSSPTSKGLMAKIKAWLKWDSVQNTIALAAATIIPIMFYESFIGYLPVLGIIVGSFLTLVFYFITVQIYYILLPFFAAYSFTANQPHVLTNALAKFLLISLRPIILVVSVLIALLAVSIFHGILE